MILLIMRFDLNTNFHFKDFVGQFISCFDPPALKLRWTGRLSMTVY